MELTKFVAEQGEKLKQIGFDAEDIWNAAIMTRAHPEKASLALAEFASGNPQVDLNLYRGKDEIINRFWLNPPGPRIEDLGPNEFIKFMFVLGITIE
jgi:hypothetical protein